MIDLPMIGFDAEVPTTLVERARAVLESAPLLQRKGAQVHVGVEGSDLKVRYAFVYDRSGNKVNLRGVAVAALVEAKLAAK